MTDRRPITAAVRRRAWGELGVRPWTFLALMLGLAAVVMVGLRWGDWLHERRVIASGTPVTADVVFIGHAELREGNRDEALYVRLSYIPPATGNQITSDGDLPRKPGQILTTQDKLQIRIDPAHPDYWTERTEPAPATLVMATPLMLGGVAFLCLLVAVVKRRGALAAYRAAEPMAATVIAVRQSPLAPLSKLLSVTLDTSEDRRVRDCYWPNRAGTIHAQQPIVVWVTKNRTFAAAAYGLPDEVLPGSGAT